MASASPSAAAQALDSTAQRTSRWRPGDGLFLGRPALLGTCDRQQTRQGYEQLDSLWEQARQNATNLVLCRRHDGSLNTAGQHELVRALTGTSTANVFGHQCLALTGTTGRDSTCASILGHRSELQDALLRRLTLDASSGAYALSPDHIFQRAMDVSGQNVQLALWSAYRVSSLLSGAEGASRYPGLVAAMSHMRSSCNRAGLEAPAQRAAVVARYFLLALLAYDFRTTPELSTLAERTASFGSLQQDPDLTTAHWEGLQFGQDLASAVLEQGPSFSHCMRAQTDAPVLTLGQPALSVELGLNDETAPTSLLGRTPPALVAAVGEVLTPGLSVTPLLTPYAGVSLTYAGPPGPKKFTYALTDGTLASNEATVTVDVQCPSGQPDWDPAVQQCVTTCGDCAGNQYCDTTSGTPQCVCPPERPIWDAPTQQCLDCGCSGGRSCDVSSGAPQCVCPPERPNWNPSTLECEPLAQCGTGASASGGDEGYQRTYDLGASAGTVTLNFKTYTVKDRIRVVYQGVDIIDTGCVGTSGTKSAPYSGASSRVTVVVEPNCAGGSGTVWDFSLSCG
jgi:hypothetical protein